MLLTIRTEHTSRFTWYWRASDLLTAVLPCILMTTRCNNARANTDSKPMRSFIPQPLQHSRQRLALALLFGLLLGLGQLLLSTHAHAGEWAQHENCVLCHQQGSGFDESMPKAALPYFGQLSQHTSFVAGMAPFILPLAPRARAPPTSH